MRVTATLIFALTIACALPSLGGGFLNDDFAFRRVLKEHRGQPFLLLNLYRLLDARPEVRDTLKDKGILPWWSDRDVKIAFFRPLSIALILFDDAAFGDWAPGYHLHSIFWYLLLCLIAWWIFKMLLPEPVALWALCLFALHESHAQAIHWTSNRHSTVAATLALLGLWAHIRARQEGWRPGRVLAPTAWALALFAGESALGGFAYVACYELIGRREALAQRLRALLPGGAIAGPYLILYKKLGYGCAASGMYIDPIGEPLRFWSHAPSRALVLIGSFVDGLPADLLNHIWTLEPWLALLGAIALAGVWLLWRSSQPRSDKLAPTVLRGPGWLYVGSLLALVPSLGAYPAGRLFLLPSLGFAALIAVLLERLRTNAKTGAARWLFAAFVVFEVGRLPFTLIGTELRLNRLAADSLEVARSTDWPAPQEHAVILAASDYLATLYNPWIREFLGQPTPASWLQLSPAPHPHRLRRVSADTLELTLVEGRWFERAIDQISRVTPIAAGERFRAGPMTVTVLQVADGQPSSISVHFDRPLDDPSLVFLAWQKDALRKVTLPPPGGIVELPYTQGPAEKIIP